MESRRYAAQPSARAEAQRICLGLVVEGESPRERAPEHLPRRDRVTECGKVQAQGCS